MSERPGPVLSARLGRDGPHRVGEAVGLSIEVHNPSDQALQLADPDAPGQLRWRLLDGERVAWAARPAPAPLLCSLAAGATLETAVSVLQGQAVDAGRYRLQLGLFSGAAVHWCEPLPLWLVAPLQTELSCCNPFDVEPPLTLQLSALARADGLQIAYERWFSADFEQPHLLSADSERHRFESESPLLALWPVMRQPMGSAWWLLCREATSLRARCGYLLPGSMQVALDAPALLLGHAIETAANDLQVLVALPSTVGWRVERIDFPTPEEVLAEDAGGDDDPEWQWRMPSTQTLAELPWQPLAGAWLPAVDGGAVTAVFVSASDSGLAVHWGALAQGRWQPAGTLALDAAVRLPQATLQLGEQSAGAYFVYLYGVPDDDGRLVLHRLTLGPGLTGTAAWQTEGIGPLLAGLRAVAVAPSLVIGDGNLSLCAALGDDGTLFTGRSADEWRRSKDLPAAPPLPLCLVCSSLQDYVALCTNGGPELVGLRGR